MYACLELEGARFHLNDEFITTPSDSLSPEAMAQAIAACVTTNVP